MFKACLVFFLGGVGGEGGNGRWWYGRWWVGRPTDRPDHPRFLPGRSVGRPKILIHLVGRSANRITSLLHLVGRSADLTTSLLHLVGRSPGRSVDRPTIYRTTIYRYHPVLVLPYVSPLTASVQLELAQLPSSGRYHLPARHWQL